MARKRNIKITLKNPKIDCFVYKEGECMGTINKDCNGCKFYRPKYGEEQNKPQSLLRDSYYIFVCLFMDSMLKQQRTVEKVKSFNNREEALSFAEKLRTDYERISKGSIMVKMLTVKDYSEEKITIE